MKACLTVICSCRPTPNLVLVDTDVVSAAPARLLVSGMGDALATYFEARACQASGATNCVGGKVTLAAMQLARLCYETLLADGLKAKLAVQRKACTKSSGEHHRGQYVSVRRGL